LYIFYYDVSGLCALLFYYPRESEGLGAYVFTGVGLSVCLSVCLFVTTITKQNVDGSGRFFWGRFLGEKEAQVRFWLRSLAGCGGYCRKTP